MCCGVSPSISKSEAPETGKQLLHAFIDLYEDADQATRMEAYFLSSGLPRIPDLEWILRQRLDNSDMLEKVVALYALAAMTRNHQDIEAFLDAFPTEPQLFVDVMQTEWTLSGTFHTGMADFLLLLAYEQRSREKALPHLARIILNMPGELESMGTYFKDPLIRAYIDKHSEEAWTWRNFENLRAFSSTGKCEEKIGNLIQHGDPASKTTAVLMTQRMWISDNLLEKIKNYHELPTDTMYSYLLTFYGDDESFSGLLFTAPETVVRLADAEKKLYSPPLRGIVGTLWHRAFHAESNRVQILRILRDILHFAKGSLENCEVDRLTALKEWK
jgi:hypothetical protein